MGSQFSSNSNPQPTMISAALVFALIAATLADQPPTYGAPPPSPVYKPAPAPYHPAPKYDESPKPYSYQYGVSDDYTGTNFAANEASDAKVVTGSYTVHLPDGRVQTVNYNADHYNGYIADVKYEGVPVYPEAKPYVPAPKYGPSY